MATLSADKSRTFETGHDEYLNELPSIAADITYDGAAVGESGATGTFRPLASGDAFAGFAIEQCDNSAGAAAARSIKVKQAGRVVLSVTGASAVTDKDKPVYATDDDTFTLTAGGTLIGYVDRWETGTRCVVRFDAASPARATVLVKTANYTATVKDSGRIIDSTGASGTITVTLPAAVPGLEYKFRVGAAQELRIDPDGTETISLPSTGVAGAAGKYLVADAAGETVYLACVKAGTWSVFGYTGTWTAEG